MWNMTRSADSLNRPVRLISGSESSVAYCITTWIVDKRKSHITKTICEERNSYDVIQVRQFFHHRINCKIFIFLRYPKVVKNCRLAISVTAIISLWISYPNSTGCYHGLDLAFSNPLVSDAVHTVNYIRIKAELVNLLVGLTIGLSEGDKLGRMFDNTVISIH